MRTTLRHTLTISGVHLADGTVTTGPHRRPGRSRRRTEDDPPTSYMGKADDSIDQLLNQAGLWVARRPIPGTRVWISLEVHDLAHLSGRRRALQDGAGDCLVNGVSGGFD